MPATLCSSNVTPLALTAPLTLAATQVVTFNADLALGTFNAGGANNLRLYACKKDAVSGVVSVVDTGSFEYRAPGPGRYYFGRSMSYRAPSDEQVALGACGCISDAAQAPFWNNHEYFHVTANVWPVGTPYAADSVNLPGAGAPVRRPAAQDGTRRTGKAR
ncbi:MAG: hypothetical protein U1F53_14390 [Burkholderiaceae bacterium]